jgi:hypothetical protein
VARLLAIIRKAAPWLILYAICWFVAHAAVFLSNGDGLGMEFLVEYFVLAWSFSAGELPIFIWLLAFAAFVVISCLFWFYLHLSRNRSGAHRP